MKDFVFVSGNMKKVYWLEKFLGRKVEHHKLDITEIQSLDTANVTEHKAREAYKILEKPVLVDDVSLKFNALGDLPGTYIKYFLEEIGAEGLCRIMGVFEDKSAEAQVTYTLYDGKDIKTITGLVKGVISPKPRGDTSTMLGMGWNSIFIPDGFTKTYAEMTAAEHNKCAVRNIAVKELKKYIETK